MKIKNGIVSRDFAKAVTPDYVDFIDGDFSKFKQIYPVFNKLKRGQKVITYYDGNFLHAKVSSVDNKSYMAVDGPVIRVSNGEYSWRVDGSEYAYPLS